MYTIATKWIEHLKKLTRNLHILLITHNSDFNLSGGCFGTDIIQKWTKWFQIGVHGLIVGPIFAKFQCASFSHGKTSNKLQYGPNNHKHLDFREKIFEKLHASHQSWKNKCSDIIYLNVINLVIYN